MSSSSMSKPWRKPKEAVRAEKAETQILFQADVNAHIKNKQCDINARAIVFCYEADALVEGCMNQAHDGAAKHLLDCAHVAVERFRQAATNGESADIIEVARSAAAASLRNAGLGEAMQTALRKQPPNKWPVMHEIIPHLWCGGWAAINDDCRALRERGVKRIVSVVSADKRKLPKEVAEQHLHVHAHDDGNAKLLPHFPKIVQFVESALADGAPVFIHCGAGISRAPTAVTACIMWRFRLSAKDALKFVKKARPSVRPNTNFVQQLIEWEQMVQLGRGSIFTVLNTGDTTIVDTAIAGTIVDTIAGTAITGTAIAGAIMDTICVDATIAD